MEIRDTLWQVVRPQEVDSFTADFLVPAYVWGPVAHGLGRVPAVQCQDVTGEVFETDVVVDDTNVTATHGVALTGKIVCS